MLGAVFVALFAHLLCGQCDGDREIQTQSTAEIKTAYIGTLSEYEFDSKKYTTAKFLGIPFALPPERFAKPVLDAPKVGVIKATKFGNICPQDGKDDIELNQNMSEDCLYLNIYVPVNSIKSENMSNTLSTTTRSPSFGTASTSTSTRTSNNSTETRNLEVTTASQYNSLYLPTLDTKYAALIYIHGGAFLKGTGNSYDGSVLAGYGNIIVVTINYRLGNFGFLSTNDDIIPGNLGLWDQHIAIQWVNKYIHIFGGDPGRVTLGGQSAGSYSTVFQGLYEGNNNLFQRMIAQSGTPTAAKSTSKVGYKTTVEVAKRANCSTTGTKSEIKLCLIRKSVEDLVKINLPMLVPASLSIQPTLDSPLVTEDPYLVMSQMVTPPISNKPTAPPHFTSKDLLIGINAQDGDIALMLFARLITGGNFNLTVLRQLLGNLINADILKLLITSYFQNDFYETIDTHLIEAVLQNYIDWGIPQDNFSQINQIIAMATDIIFAIPSLDTAAAHIQKFERNEASLGSKNISGMKTQGSTFVYRFSLPEPEISRYLPLINGTGHAAEIIYVFGSVEQDYEADVNLTKAVMTYWSNFVKSGDPNKENSSAASAQNDQNIQLPFWKAYTLDDEHFLELSTNPVSKSRMRANFRHFWTQFIPKLKYRLQSTCTNKSSGQDILRINFVLFGLTVTFPLMFLIL